MRFHVVDIAHQVANGLVLPCAFTTKMMLFCSEMKKRGHEIIHYGHETSTVDCTESIPIFFKEDWDTFWSNEDYYNNTNTHYTNVEANNLIASRASEVIKRHKKPNDIFLSFIGNCQSLIAQENPDLIAIEPSIGYHPKTTFSEWKVYESYAMMHMCAGIEAACYDSEKGGLHNWYDAVIPSYFDTSLHEYQETKDDYILYLGRVFEGKGLYPAIEATKLAGKKLVVAGYGDIIGDKLLPYDSIPDHVEIVGYADHEKRSELMRNASASLMLTTYAEPFGRVLIENFLHGTPVITTDWGAFVENNLHGVTGYRARTLDHIVWSIRNIDNIKSRDCRNWGETFSVDRIMPMYEEYFNMVMDEYTSIGWYRIHADRDNLNWLNYQSPFKSSDEPVLKTKQQVMDKVTQDYIIPHGIFKGMKYVNRGSAGAWYEPKLLGTYESEIVPAMKEILQTRYTGIVDVGCGEGYYATGLAWKNPQAKVYAFDTNEDAQNLCSQNVKLNNLDNVVIGDWCDANTLVNLNIGRRGLIFIDCEGYEVELITRDTVQELYPHDFIIETHDWVDINITKNLIDILSDTHNIQIFSSVDDIDKAYNYDVPILNGLSLEDRRDLLREGRCCIGKWIYAKSKLTDHVPINRLSHARLPTPQ